MGPPRFFFWVPGAPASRGNVQGPILAPLVTRFRSATCGGGAPLDGVVRLVTGARGALRAGREVQLLMALSDEALARRGLTRDGIAPHALRLHLPD